MIKRHTLIIDNKVEGELRISARALAEVLQTFIESVSRNLRLTVDGHANMQGGEPGWLSPAIDFDVTGIRPGSAKITLEAPTLIEASKDFFEDFNQRDLFDDSNDTLDVKLTSIDLFASTMKSAMSSSDDLMADRFLLKSIVEFMRTMETYDLESISIDGDMEKPVSIPRARLAEMERLLDMIPLPQAVRVKGRLDSITASSGKIALLLKDRQRLHGVIPDKYKSDELLRSLFNKEALIWGRAHFRPNRKVIRIEINGIREAYDRDDIWERYPVPLEVKTPIVQHKPQTETTGVGAFFGKWPGEETSEELLRLLQECS